MNLHMPNEVNNVQFSFRKFHISTETISIINQSETITLATRTSLIFSTIILLLNLFLVQDFLCFVKWLPESLSWRPFCLAPVFLFENSFSEFWKTFLSVLMLTRFFGEGIGDNSSEIFGRSLFLELKSFGLKSVLSVPLRKGGNDFLAELIVGLPKGWSGAC